MPNSTAYGFMSIKDLFVERVADNLTIVGTAIADSIAEYQREMDAMLSILIQPTTDYSIRYQLPGSGTLQPLDQHGNPLPILPSGFYDIAFPIQGAGTAWGNNRITRALMTVADANRFTLSVMNADMDWMARHILASVFTNTSWSYVDDDHGTLTIQPLANGDSVLYTRKGGTSSIDNHYLAQLAVIADATNPYDDIYDELSEHPSNSGPFVAYIPTALKATTMALTNFIEIGDPDIQLGTDVSTIRGSIGAGFGDMVLGKTDNMWIVEWKRLPADIIVAVAQGSDPVIGMRQYPAAALQGLFPEFQDIDGNRHLSKWLRFCGFGVMNRVGMVVQRIGNASYAIPTGYTSPLAV